MEFLFWGFFLVYSGSGRRAFLGPLFSDELLSWACEQIDLFLSGRISFWSTHKVGRKGKAVTAE